MRDRRRSGLSRLVDAVLGGFALLVLARITTGLAAELLARCVFGGGLGGREAGARLGLTLRGTTRT